MSKHVLIQVGSLTELFVTHCTRMRFFTCMRQLVFREKIFSCKILQTDLNLINKRKNNKLNIFLTTGKVK